MKWISVKERLPCINEDVLIYSSNYGVIKSFLYDPLEERRNKYRGKKDSSILFPINLVWRSDECYYCGIPEIDLNKIYHWMPLPEEPKE